MVVAVSTIQERSAQQATETFGIQYSFDNHTDLIACPDVDLVVTTDKVPAHFKVWQAQSFETWNAITVP
jgi:predicted dehydrogenase